MLTRHTFNAALRGAVVGGNMTTTGTSTAGVAELSCQPSHVVLTGVLCSPSYFAASCGGAPIRIIRP